MSRITTNPTVVATEVSVVPPAVVPLGVSIVESALAVVSSGSLLDSPMCGHCIVKERRSIVHVMVVVIPVMLAATNNQISRLMHSTGHCFQLFHSEIHTTDACTAIKSSI